MTSRPPVCRSSMKLDLRPGDRVSLAGDVEVELEHKSGRMARLKITAPRDVKIAKIESDRDDLVPSMTQ